MYFYQRNALLSIRAVIYVIFYPVVLWNLNCHLILVHGNFGILAVKMIDNE